MENCRHQFSQDKLSKFKKAFDKYNTDENARLHHTQLLTAIQQLVGVDVKITDIETILKEIDDHKTKNIDFNSFVSALWLIKSKDDASGFAKLIQPKLIPIKVNYGSYMHPHSRSESSTYAKIFNHCLKNESKLKYLLPIIPHDPLDLMKKICDGVLVAIFLNTIDWRTVNYEKNGNLNRAQMIQNQTLNIFTAKSMGMQIYGICAEDLVDAEKNMVMALGFLWQIIKAKLLNCINIRSFPYFFNELIEEGHILDDGEELNDLFSLCPHEILYRWVNYHMKKRQCSNHIRNFSKDLKDGKVYIQLLKSIIGNQKRFLIDTQFDKVVEALKMAQSVGINTFLTANDIMEGYEKLNGLFIGELFHWNVKHKLQRNELLVCGYCKLCNVSIVTDIINLIIENLKVLNTHFKDRLNEYNYTLTDEIFLIKWINSLGLSNVYVYDLFYECSYGLVLLKLIDKISPGAVGWRKVEQKPTNKFKRLSNANYSIVLGKQLGIPLLNIGGFDIVDRNKKLVVYFVWQLMRWYLLRQCMVVTERNVSENDILLFCNESIINSTLKIKPQITSFGDPIISSGMFLICLIASINASVINWDFVIQSADIHNNNHRISNAKYMISLLRKIGVNNIFLLPEHIVNVNNKMVMTVCAAVMAQNNKIRMIQN